MRVGRESVGRISGVGARSFAAGGDVLLAGSSCAAWVGGTPERCEGQQSGQRDAGRRGAFAEYRAVAAKAREFVLFGLCA